MAKIGLLKILGVSGSVYHFDAYPLNTVWNPISAVFIVTHRDVRSGAPTEHIQLRLGQSKNLQELPHTAPEWCGHKANCICVLQEKSEARRREIVADIAGANTFPL